MGHRKSGISIVLWLLTWQLVCAPHRGGTEPDSGAEKPGTVSAPADAGSLVRALGDVQYKVRQQAAEQLRNLGPAALPALEEAAKSMDPEVATAARELLPDIRLGITAAWPADLAAAARGFASLPSGEERLAFLLRVTTELGAEGMPFLVSALADLKDVEAEWRRLLMLLQEKGTVAMAERVVTLLPKPGNAAQVDALVWALLKTGQQRVAMKWLKDGSAVGVGQGHDLVAAAVKDLCALHAGKRYEQLAKQAGEYRAAMPDEARFLYLQAAALAAQGQGAEAERLAGQALALSPTGEAPHYTAGVLLGELGCRNWARREWERILEIPPADDVYDSNAWLRLADILAQEGKFGAAADLYQKAVDLVAARRAGGDMSMGITDEARVNGLIRDLRGKAAQQAAVAAVPLVVTIRAVVKDAAAKELQAALAQTGGALRVSIEPLGVRLLDVDGQCTVVWNEARQDVAVALHGQPCTKPAKVSFPGKDRRLAIEQLDCVYIYEMPAVDGVARKLARYEYDYTVTARLKDEAAGWRVGPLKVADKAYAWADLVKGVTLDYLPDSLDFACERAGADGKPEVRTFRIAPAPGQDAAAAGVREQPPPYEQEGGRGRE